MSERLNLSCGPESCVHSFVRSFVRFWERGTATHPSRRVHAVPAGRQRVRTSPLRCSVCALMIFFKPTKQKGQRGLVCGVLCLLTQR